MDTNSLIRLWREDQGQDLVEYGLLLVLLALSAIAGMGALANAINSTFASAAANISAAAS